MNLFNNYIWVARNKDGSLSIAEEEVSLVRFSKDEDPNALIENGCYWWDDMSMHDVLIWNPNKDYFPELKWEDEPMKVYINLKYLEDIGFIKINDINNESKII